jgi:protocatechuate 4,5-dioxygenase alpha chain
MRAREGCGAMTASNWIHPLPSPEMFRINRVLYDIQHNREKEAAFFADKADFVGRYPALSEQSRSAIITCDIGKLYLLGANPYLLRAYCLQLRVPEQEYLDALRAVAGEPADG